jgi:hypothetical protein
VVSLVVVVVVVVVAVGILLARLSLSTISMLLTLAEESPSTDRTAGVIYRSTRQ